MMMLTSNQTGRTFKFRPQQISVSLMSSSSKAAKILGIHESTIFEIALKEELTENKISTDFLSELWHGESFLEVS